MKHQGPTAALHLCRSIPLVALLLLGSAACKSTSQSTDAAAPRSGRVDLSNEVVAKAVVLVIDPAARVITLRRDDGSVFAVQASPEIRNFNQINAGDVLRVRYHEALSATLLPAGSTTTPVESSYAAGRAAPGEQPAGGVGVAATRKVKIAAVDHENHIVVFALETGEFRTVSAKRDEGRRFVEKLKVGDIVQIDYTASLALAVEKL